MTTKTETTTTPIDHTECKLDACLVADAAFAAASRLADATKPPPSLPLH